jgi:hypothetical protein
VAKLIYSAITSLDGYIEDEDGKFDWSEPDEEVHSFVNELVRTSLLTRSRRVWSTSSTCSSRPRSWEAASSPCRTTCA